MTGERSSGKQIPLEFEVMLPSVSVGAWTRSKRSNISNNDGSASRRLYVCSIRTHTSCAALAMLVARLRVYLSTSKLEGNYRALFVNR